MKTQYKFTEFDWLEECDCWDGKLWFKEVVNCE